MEAVSNRIKTVIIAAESNEFVSGLALYCVESERYTVVGLARSATALFRRIHEFAPDAVIIDCDIPQHESIDSIQYIRLLQPDVAIIALGDYTAPSMVNRAFQQGANGYLLAMPHKQQLIDALDCTGRGELVLDRQLQHLITVLDSHGAMTIV